MKCDVTDFASVEHLRDAALDEFGAVHLLCNNAGIGAGAEGALWEHELNDWRWAFNVNVYGIIHGINAFAALLNRTAVDCNSKPLSVPPPTLFRQQPCFRPMPRPPSSSACRTSSPIASPARKYSSRLHLKNRFRCW